MAPWWSQSMCYFFIQSCFKYLFRMCHKARESVLVSKCSSKLFQIPSEVTIYRLLFFSAVPNRFKYRQNAPFIVLVFNFSSAVPNSFECRQNTPFSVLVLKKICEVPYTCSIRCRQNAPFIVRVFKIISVIPNCYKYHQKAPSTFLIFQISRRLPRFKDTKLFIRSIAPSMWTMPPEVLVSS